MSKFDVLDTVDAYIIRVMVMASNAHTDGDYIGFVYILARLEDFEDWLMGIHRAI